MTLCESTDSAVATSVRAFKHTHVLFNSHEWFSVQPKKRMEENPPFGPIDFVLWANDDKENES